MNSWIKDVAEWLIPSIQSIHILAIAVVVGSVFLMSLRVLGVAGTDQTVRQVNRRFMPWFYAALWVLLATGAVLIVSEPPRELLAFSFWAKMAFLAVGIAIAVGFSRSVRADETRWEGDLSKRGSVRAMAVGAIVITVIVILLGRLIAYNHVWGSLFGAAQS
jgi:uncharacterized membrane protein